MSPKTGRRSALPASATGGVVSLESADGLRIFEPGRPAKSPSRARKLLLGTIGLACLAVLSVLITASDKRTGENRIYRKAAERVLQGEQFYRPDDPPSFTYPPFMVLFYAPLTFLPDRAARAAWSMTNLCLLTAIIWMTVRLVRPLVVTGRSCEEIPMLRWRARLAIGAVALLSLRYELSELAYQGHDYWIYLFAMLAMTARADGASVRGGAFAGLAAAAKATPLLFLPVFVWQRQWRAASAMVAFTVLATLLPDLLFPAREGGLWVCAWHQKFIAHVNIGAVPDVSGSWASWNELNQSLPGTLSRLFTRVETVPGWRWDVSLIDLSPAMLRIVTLGAECIVLGLLLFSAWPRRPRDEDDAERSFTALGQGSAVLCGMLLLSPMSSVQHFCFLLAPICFCCLDFLYRRRDPWVGAGLVLLLCNGVAGRDIIGPAAHVQLQAYGHLTWVCLLTLGMCGYILHGRAQGARAVENETAAADGAVVAFRFAPRAPRDKPRKAA